MNHCSINVRFPFFGSNFWTKKRPRIGNQNLAVKIASTHFSTEKVIIVLYEVFNAFLQLPVRRISPTSCSTHFSNYLKENTAKFKEKCVEQVDI